MPEFSPAMIAAVDIGSPMAGRLGWAVLPNERTGKDIPKLVALITEALREGPVALGFEAPLWVPMRADVMTLTKARVGEGSRSWSGFAGPTVLTTGLGVIPYVLTAIRKSAPDATATLDFLDPPSEPGSLLLWEAFVSADDKGDGDEDDALIAARAFQRACADLPGSQKLTPEPCFNLAGAMLLRTGWSSDLSLLEADMLVVK